MKKKKLNAEDIIVDVVVTVVLLLLTFICLYPLWYVLMCSFTDSTEITMAAGIMFWPKKFGLNAYNLVFNHKLFMSGYANTLKVLALSLPLNLALTLLCGYFLSCSGMFWKKPISAIILFTMYFSGGMIPGFLNVKSLGLYNTIWALVLTGALSVYNSIICKTAIEAIPPSLKESAYIDGANDIQIIYKIIVPLIKPTLAVLTLYYGVAHWSSWFSASIYMKDNEKLPIQNILRSVLLQNTTLLMESNDIDDYAETIKYAAIVITTVPILCIYPFLQKYFAKGVMIGAVKG